MFSHTPPDVDALFRADQAQYLALRPAAVRRLPSGSPPIAPISGDSPFAGLRPLSDPCHRTGIPSPVSSVSSALTDAVLAATGLPFMHPSPVPVRPASLISLSESFEGASFEDELFDEPTDEPLSAFEALKAEYEAYFSSESESSRSSSPGSSRASSADAADVDEPLPAFLALKAEYESYFSSEGESSRSVSRAATSASPESAAADCPALAGVREPYATHTSRMASLPPRPESRWSAPSSCGCPPSSTLSLTSEFDADFDSISSFEPVDAVEAFSSSDSEEFSRCEYLSSFSSLTSSVESVDTDAGSICSDAELLSVLGRDADWDEDDDEEEDGVPRTPASAKDTKASANWEAGSLCSDAELLSVLSRDADWDDDDEEEEEDCVLRTPASVKEERELAFLRRTLPVSLLQRALPLHHGEHIRESVESAILKSEPVDFLSHFPAPPTTSRAALAGRFISEMSALLDKYSALVK